MALRVLVVDDDETIRTSLVEALAGDAVDVRAAASAEAALGMLGDSPPDVVISDVRMPGLDGLELLKLLSERAPSADVIIMTAYDDMPTVVSAMREGAFDFLPKPLDLHDLRHVLVRVAEDRRARERARRAVEDHVSQVQLGQLVGHDPRMIQIYKLVGQLAANRASVLIRGETGTGKELIARAIHFNSPDAEEPFVPVNCTALPTTLLESELFGHKRGAFTGAIADRRGRFALAGRGTIFLDEIGDTAPEFQTKLLRVLEHHEFYAVGSEHADRTDARVVAATHRKLEELIAAGTFREDLYYRLRVVEIHVPPLRDRLGDLPLLAEHLVALTAEDLHRPAPVLSEEAMEALLAHRWPGNVRELENALTRAVVLATGDVIHPEHLALGHRTESPTELLSLDEMEQRHVVRILEVTGGHKTRAAQILGVSRPRLNRLIEKYGLE
ncbi:MAG: sigma-54 dependent transcriptional regulator [Gemmatimonadota bacterium]|nr:sigma-54 dependent transcriptional regulator [Gemmatimonadota bacterium]MDH3367998.1 sigma-54 dependent transcriptional regulator [Gemmatimonadota bacterium]MDH3479479.1 sigma-54 dependent transcriptional regulator [Gemmatimonadota bacterium]MDH3570059.1 sigma-54 dependent transcriptional regulator [Gemmatimonadota bacterium]MDH5550373.1 sigma-54 dependent transcriptional regulator [Gemmatimonadota bacterium]